MDFFCHNNCELLFFLSHHLDGGLLGHVVFQLEMVETPLSLFLHSLHELEMVNCWLMLLLPNWQLRA
jgi:hypothetical protein